MAEFFAMGGYAAYVWPSYALAAAVMIGLLALSLWELKDNEATLKALETLRPNRRARRQKTDADENAMAQPTGDPAAQDG